AMVKMFHNLYRMPTVVVRPSLVYGPGQNIRFFIPQMIRDLLAGNVFNMTYGEQFRDFIYIDDVVEGLIEIYMHMNKLQGETVNICYGESIQLKELVLNASLLMESTSQINFGAIPYREREMMSYQVSNAKLRSKTTWKPRITLQEGLLRTISQ